MNKPEQELEQWAVPRLTIMAVTQTEAGYAVSTGDGEGTYSS